MTNLLNIETALEQILKGIVPLPAEYAGIEQALGRVLADDIRADSNLPPFANSSVDGYAVRAKDIIHASKETPVSLRVTLDIPAGSTPGQEVGSMQAARIMTGAPLPSSPTTNAPSSSMASAAARPSR